MREQRLGATRLLLNPLMTAQRERTVTRKMMVALGLGYIHQLFAGRVAISMKDARVAVAAFKSERQVMRISRLLVELRALWDS